MNHYFTFIFLALIPLATYAGSSTLRQQWSSGKYISRPLPNGVNCKGASPVESISTNSVSNFVNPVSTLKANDFLCHFGSPTRFLAPVSGRGDSFYIYDLSNGDSIALYVSGEQWTAIVGISKEGTVLRLLK